MKKPVPAKILTLVLAAALLVAPAAASAGDIWCFGSDVRLAIQFGGPGECCESVCAQNEDLRETACGPGQNGDSCATCLDVFRDKVAPSLLKRYLKIAASAVSMVSSDSRDWPLPHTLVFCGKGCGFAERVSPAIRSHRTVVLLN